MNIDSRRLIKFSIIFDFIQTKPLKEFKNKNTKFLELNEVINLFNVYFYDFNSMNPKYFT